MEIKDLYEIVKGGGAIGVLFITNVMLWMKLDKKEQMFYDLVKSLDKTNSNQEKTNILLQNVLNNLMK